MCIKFGVKISPGRISPNLNKNFPFAFHPEDKFLLKLREIYSKLRLMKWTQAGPDVNAFYVECKKS